jgi:aspartate/methionine/tyrosine aminotransferase
MATIRHKMFSFYDGLEQFETTQLNDSSCVFICDPSNPTGIKLDDDFLYSSIEKITKTGAIVIFDSPYRKLFTDDDFFDKLAKLDNLIITESFSKWVGLSGLRMGFIFCKNKAFNSELNIRLLYEVNGVSTVPQIIIEKIITTLEGRKALDVFRKTTTENIAKNIYYLHNNNLLVKEMYYDKKPLGIFAVITKAEDYLFQHKIGAVGMDKFVYHDRDFWSSYSRICVSVEYEIFKKFISKII